MAERRIPVTLRLGDTFSGRLAHIAQLAHDIHAAETLARATWEPHDWSDF